MVECFQLGIVKWFLRHEGRGGVLGGLFLLLRPLFSLEREQLCFAKVIDQRLGCVDMLRGR